jgi:hypothetical protein
LALGWQKKKTKIKACWKTKQITTRRHSPMVND